MKPYVEYLIFILAANSAYSEEVIRFCKLPTPENGEVIMNGTVAVINTTIAVASGSEITLECYPGFAINGQQNTTSHCFSNGTWSTNLYDCQLSHQLWNISTQSNNRIFLDETTFPNDITTTPLQTTTADDITTTEDPKCTQPPYIPNGDITTLTGSLGLIVCHNGFRLFGVDSVYCTPSGDWWLVGNPKCLLDTTSTSTTRTTTTTTSPKWIVQQKDTGNRKLSYLCKVTKPVGGYLRVSEGRINKQGYASSGAIVELICFDPKAKIRYGSDISICERDGYFTEMFGRCVLPKTATTITTPAPKVKCRIPKYLNITNGLVNSGVKLTLSCSVNDILHGPNSSTCLPDGTWSNLFGTCIKKDIIRSVRNHNWRTLKILLEAGVSADATDKDGWTALMWATFTRDPLSVRMLIQYNCNINAGNSANSTALHLAAKNGDVVMTRFLIQRGAYVNAANVFGITPLLFAVRQNHVATAVSLLHYGANVLYKDDLGNSAIHWAARTGNKVIAELLINHECDIDDQNNNQQNALILASQRGYLSVVELLLDHDADVNKVDISGLTAGHYAEVNGFTEILTAINEHKRELTTPPVTSS